MIGPLNQQDTNHRLGTGQTHSVRGEQTMQQTMTEGAQQMAGLLRRWNPAWMLAVGLVLAGLLNGGVYQTVPVEGGGAHLPVAYRVNRFTGDVLYLVENKQMEVIPETAAANRPK